MTILVSAQNNFHYPGGIGEYIKKKYNKKDCIFLHRENIRKNYFIVDQKIIDLKKEIKKINPSEAHIHSILDSGIFGGLIGLLKELKIKTTYFCHSLVEEQNQHLEEINELNRLQQQAQEEIFDKCTLIIFFNKIHKDQVLKKFPEFKTKSHVIENNITKRGTDKAKRSKIVLYVGRISKEKGIFDLANSFKEFSKIDKDYKLVILGKHKTFRNNTSEVESILEGTNYEILDWINDKKVLNSYYRRASLVVVPSHYDSHNLVVQEAISLGVPVLLSNIPVFRELYIRRGLVKSFQVRNITSLYTSMAKSLKSDKFPQNL